MIWSHTCEQSKWQSIEQPGYGRGYVEALRYWREFLDRVNYLRDAKRMTTILIGHSAIKRFEAPDAESFDRYVIKLQAKACDLVSEHSDATVSDNGGDEGGEGNDGEPAELQAVSSAGDAVPGGREAAEEGREHEGGSQGNASTIGEGARARSAEGRASASTIG